MIFLGLRSASYGLGAMFQPMGIVPAPSASFNPGPAQISIHPLYTQPQLPPTSLPQIPTSQPIGPIVAPMTPTPVVQPTPAQPTAIFQPSPQPAIQPVIVPIVNPQPSQGGTMPMISTGSDPMAIFMAQPAPSGGAIFQPQNSLPPVPMMSPAPAPGPMTSPAPPSQVEQPPQSYLPPPPPPPPLPPTQVTVTPTSDGGATVSTYQPPPDYSTPPPAGPSVQTMPQPMVSMQVPSTGSLAMSWLVGALVVGGVIAGGIAYRRHRARRRKAA